MIMRLTTSMYCLREGCRLLWVLVRTACMIIRLTASIERRAKMTAEHQERQELGSFRAVLAARTVHPGSFEVKMVRRQELPSNLQGS